MSETAREWGDAGVKYRPIPSRPGYFAGADGSIWSTKGKTAIRRKPSVLPNRRYYICFAAPVGCVQVPHLILEAFVGPRPDGMECCHNDGDCQNNRPDNLRWDTRASNLADRHQHGSFAVGSRHGKALVTEADVSQIVKWRDEGLTPAQIGRRIGRKAQLVRDILNGRTWNHVTGIPKPARPR